MYRVQPIIKTYNPSGNNPKQQQKDKDKKRVDNPKVSFEDLLKKVLEDK